MPVAVKKIGDRFRVVEAATGRVVKRNGRPIDGNGHTTKEGARKQVAAINISLKKRGKI